MLTLLLCRAVIARGGAVSSDLERHFGRGKYLLQQCNFSCSGAVSAWLVVSPRVDLCGERGRLWHGGYDCSDGVWLDTDLLFHSHNFS